MKPYPFWGLNHFTVPILMVVLSKNRKCRRTRASGGSNFDTVRGAGPALDRALGRANRTTGESTPTEHRLSRVALQLGDTLSPDPRPLPGRVFSPMEAARLFCCCPLGLGGAP